MESVLLERYRVVLQGAVLELVPGGSQLTEELLGQARSYTGLGPSIALINVCRQVYPRGKFIHGDVSALDQFDPGGLDAVVAWRCAIDFLSDDSRRELLGRARQVLNPGGVLIFSSHNRMGEDPEPSLEAHGRRGGRLLRGLRMRSSRAAMDERELGAELLSGLDPSGNERAYRINRDEQERQLAEVGFELAECLDLEGRPVGPGVVGADMPELHYVARPGEAEPASPEVSTGLEAA